MLLQTFGKRDPAVGLRCLQSVCIVPQFTDLYPVNNTPRNLLHTSNIPSAAPAVIKPPSEDGSTVVLVSGGLKSTALLSYWTHWNHASNIIPLFVNYGQKNSHKQESAARAVCRKLGLPPLWDLSDDFLADHFRQTKEEYTAKGVNIPYLEKVFLLSLAKIAAKIGRASYVALALSKEHADSNSGAFSEFLLNEKARLQNAETPVTLLTPLVNLSLPDILKLGEEAKTPWELTWTCLEDGKEPCGVCEGCKMRTKVLSELSN